MTLRLHDTRTRSLRAFEPLQPGHVGMYVCGPTVQAAPHVGHLRSAVAFDIVRRWLLVSGYEVTYVRNVTDIDDKIIATAAAEHTTVWALAERNTRAFNAAYDAVGVLAPTIEPRATGHIPEIVEMMGVLVDRGHAYPADGSVWFDVASYPAYGALSGQRPDAMQASAESEGGKRDPRDFALWKGARAGEPSWPTPWGAGRPGWHLECSAMAGKYLGHPFDIHGAGLDLVFPHHENERAQSICAYDCARGGRAGDQGGEMARFWLHNGLVTTGGEKMSKSLGNSFFVAVALATTRPVVLRYHLGSAHYRSPIEYTAEGLLESAAAYERIEAFVSHAAAMVGAEEGEVDAAVWAEFAAAMDDDLGVSRALATVFAAVTRGNAALRGRESGGVATALATSRRMLGVLGLDPLDWAARSDGAELRGVVDALVPVLLETRSAARARKDYAESDRIRDAVAAAGLTVEDTPDGTRWRVG